MEITSNFSIVNLFANNKAVKIFTSIGTITVHLKSIGEFYNNEKWTMCYMMITNADKRKQILPKDRQSLDDIEEIKTLIFELGKYIQYQKVVSIIREQLLSTIDDLNYDFQNKQLKIKDGIITSDIWNYIIYILKLSCGEKEEKPLTFQDEYSKQLYLAQKEFEKKVHKIKSQNGGNDEQILKILLTISYQIPSLTFDYLFNQTMAQIHWLYLFAAKSVSYQVGAMTYAAGNMKQGKTPEFFIK